MADSSITKRALASALKDLMEELPFDKIQVAHICERCNMNRKSFYYHFKDKYDLLNWIFDVEMITFFQHTFNILPLEQRVKSLENVCNYFYDNRNFYRKALQITGQNSFRDHLREYVMPYLKLRFSHMIDSSDFDFELNFLTDITICAFERWISDKNCMLPGEFISRLLRIGLRGSELVQKEFQDYL